MAKTENKTLTVGFHPCCKTPPVAQRAGNRGSRDDSEERYVWTQAHGLPPAHQAELAAAAAAPG